MPLLILLGAMGLCGPGHISAFGIIVERQERDSSLENDKGREEFLERVRAYAKLRDDAREGISPIHRKDSPEQIRKHEELLAARIQETRKSAKEGDVFTASAKRAFRHDIGMVFSSKDKRAVDKTLVQGEPVKLELYVNKPYPDNVPITTVPPTLLQHFPQLPKDLEYRVVGSDLVLEDVESLLVIDIFAGAFQNAPTH